MHLKTPRLLWRKISWRGKWAKNAYAFIVNYTGGTELQGQLFTLKEVEETTKLSRSTLYRRLRKGTLQGQQLDNGMWRVPWEEVQRVLGRRQTRAETE